MNSFSTGFFVFWTFLAFLIGAWNRGRGNSFLLGFFLSLIFTPIVGILFVGFTKRNEENIEKRSIKAGKMKKCPSCAELIRSEAKKCRYCGADQ